MRAVVQRSDGARVTVDGRVVGEIGPGPGLVVLLGVGASDTEKDAAYLAEKTANLRIFPDTEGKMNLSVLDLRARRAAAAADGQAGHQAGGRASHDQAGGQTGREQSGDRAGEVLVVSQFTLYGDCRKGRRPSYTDAAPPGEADRLYQEYVRCLRGYGLRVATGEFQAMMRVELVNDGPVTILLDSRKLF